MKQLFTLFIGFSFLLTTASFAQTNNSSQKESNEFKLATRTEIINPTGLAIDKEGINLYVIEAETAKILGVDLRTGFISVFAGNGNPNQSGDGGLAINAGFYPTDITVDNSGNLLIAEIGGRIRRVDANTNIIITIAGNGKMGDEGTGDGGLAINAAFRSPDGVAVDSDGNIFVSDSLDHRIRRIDAKTGIITTYAGGGKGESGDGEKATSATFRFPGSIAFDKENNLFIADTGIHRICRIDAKTQTITTVAGFGADYSVNISQADKANMTYSGKLTVDAEGYIYTNAGRDGFIFRIDTKNNLVTKYAGNGKKGIGRENVLATKAKIRGTSGMVFDKAGNLYFAEHANNRIRRVDAKTGIITTVAGKL